MPRSCGSPCRSEEAIELACSHGTCGGNVATFGVDDRIDQRMDGRRLSAASQARRGPRRSDPDARQPERLGKPRVAEVRQVLSRGTVGLPDITRCSQVTWFRSRLLSTMHDQPRVGPFLPVFGDGDEAVDAVHLHGPVAHERDGWAVRKGELGRDGIGHARTHRRETAGQSDAIMPPRILRSRAYQFAAEPESTVMMP